MTGDMERDLESDKNSIIAEEGHNLWQEGPVVEKAFNKLFNYLYDQNPKVRKFAAETLSNDSKSLVKLIQIYRDYYNTDVRKSIIAGRVAGRKADNGEFKIIHSIYAQIRYGISIAFVPCSCGHCGGMNSGIPVPEFGVYKGYYGQTDYRGVFFLPVLCDICSKEFFIAWDEDPRVP